MSESYPKMAAVSTNVPKTYHVAHQVSWLPNFLFIKQEINMLQTESKIQIWLWIPRNPRGYLIK